MTASIHGTSSAVLNQDALHELMRAHPADPVLNGAGPASREVSAAAATDQLATAHASTLHAGESSARSGMNSGNSTPVTEGSAQLAAIRAGEAAAHSFQATMSSRAVQMLDGFSGTGSGSSYTPSQSAAAASYELVMKRGQTEQNEALFAENRRRLAASGMSGMESSAPASAVHSSRVAEALDVTFVDDADASGDGSAPLTPERLAIAMDFGATPTDIAV